MEKKLSRFFKKAKKISHFFVPMTQSVKEFEYTFNVPTTFIPLACDILRYGGIDKNKIIDVNGYGRQDWTISKKLSEVFNKKDNQRVYYHTDHMHISNIQNYYAHRRLFWKFLRKSKIALAFDPFSPNFNNRFRFSFIGQRWFENIAAGCVIVGRRPTCPEMEILFDWEKSTIELPVNLDESILFIENLLENPQDLEKISLKNYSKALSKHDWHHRLFDMLKIMKAEPSTYMINAIEILQNKTDL